MTKDRILGLIRHALTFIGGMLVVSGKITDTNLEILIGSVTTFVGAVWSVFSKPDAL